jgi:SAM-dependent methyltransferase
MRYLGIDASVPLLAEAARVPGPVVKKGASGFDPVDRRLLAADLVHRPLAEIDSRARFDLIVLFGLMHHVPSRARRLRLLEASAERLSPGGLLAVSFWQFGDRERFEGRFRSWHDPEAAGVDPEDLEEGDALLAWGDAGAVRYCHFAGPAEAETLVDPLGLEVLANFSADGNSNDLNLYWVLRRPR